MTELFANVSARDFLGFRFKTLSYAEQLARAQEKCRKLCGVTVILQKTQNGTEYLDVSLDFRFMGGSLGCAEARKIVLGCEYAISRRVPVVFTASSGGIRMQEGPTALMGMASTAAAVQKARRAGILTMSVFVDPCYGGSSASFMYATAVQLGVRGARIGFAGP